MCENGTVFNFGRIICLAIPSWYDYTRLFIFLYFVISDLDTDYLPYMKPEKTVDVSWSNQQFLLRAKKFHTDDMSLPSGWNFCARPQSSFREESILVASQNVGFFLRLKNMDNTSTSVV